MPIHQLRIVIPDIAHLQERLRESSSRSHGASDIVAEFQSCHHNGNVPVDTTKRRTQLVPSSLRCPCHQCTVSCELYCLSGQFVKNCPRLIKNSSFLLKPKATALGCQIGINRYLDVRMINEVSRACGFQKSYVRVIQSFRVEPYRWASHIFRPRSPMLTDPSLHNLLIERFPGTPTTIR